MDRAKGSGSMMANCLVYLWAAFIRISIGFNYKTC